MLDYTPPEQVKAKCTICGYETTFYQYQLDKPLGSENKSFAKSTGLIEEYCYKCKTTRAFQRI